uniref:Serpentine receptor class gamma n=1 Tax=Acrobeloides nanus TaxID=290746 RepID=A0A914CDE0_9BILA
MIFGLIVYSIIFCIFWWNKKDMQFNNKDRKREAKLTGAVFINTLIETAGTFDFLALMYIWPEHMFELLDLSYIIEDANRMLSPMLLLFFSRPLRKAFMQIYWKKKNLNTTLPIILSVHPNKL